MKPKGVTFILVLSLILAIVILANVALVFISSQSRYVYHHFSRIRAIHGAKSGLVFAMEKLKMKTGGWTVTGSDQFYCINDDGSMTCDDGNIVDEGMPMGIQIHIYPAGSGGATLNYATRIDATVNYKYED